MTRSRSNLACAEMHEAIEANSEDLRALRRARILITGATGWFGTWLLDLICAANESLSLDLRMSAVSRDPGRFLGRFPGFAEAACLNWIHADVRNMREQVTGFDFAIHGATDNGAAKHPAASLNLFDSIIDGTRQVLSAADRRCGGILLLSSGAIYGPSDRFRTAFTEDDVGGPDPSSTDSAYAEGKRAAETLCAIAAQQGVPVKIARCFAFVGPHMPFDRHFAIGNFIADAASGRVVRIRSDGSPVRSYLYMTDLFGALLRILVRGQCGRPYNVGSDHPVTMKELAHCVDRVVGGRGVEVAGEATRPHDRYIPDITRLRTELKFVPRVPLEEGVARTAAWYRARTP